MGVRGGEAQGEGVHLQEAGILEVQVEAPVDGLLGGAQRHPALGGQGPGHFPACLHEGVGGEDLGHQPQGLGLGGVHQAAGEDHLLGRPLAHQAGQALGAAEAGDDPQVDLRLAQPGGVRGVDEIAGHGHLQAAPQGKAVDAGDHRDLQGLQFKAGLVGRGGEGPGRQGVKLQEDLDVRPGDEGPAGPGEQQHPNLRVPAHPVQGVLELRQHLVVQGVELAPGG